MEKLLNAFLCLTCLLLCHVKADTVQCNQEIVIGGTDESTAYVNTSIVPTCFPCQNYEDMLATDASFFYVNNMIISMNADVTVIESQLIVTNFESFPLLQDGIIYLFTCLDFRARLFSRRVGTLNPIPLALLGSISEFYVEGTTFLIICINRNLLPLGGLTIWYGPTNVPVGSGGVLRLTLLRSDAGQYRCEVILNDPTIMVQIPNKFIHLVVHYPPDVTISSAFEAFNINSTLTLMCNYMSVPQPLLEWKFNGILLSNNNDSITITNTSNTSSNSSILQWTSATADAVGMFTCLATNSLGSDNRTITTQIRMPPLAAAISDNETYSRGDDVIINCSGQGFPDTFYHWQVNGTDIQEETSTTLKIFNVNASTGGEYSCMVFNSAGGVSASSFVFISPYITTQPDNREGSVGFNLILMCKAEAFSAPHYQWARADGSAIRNSVLGVNSNILSFNPLMFGDEGSYLCIATSRGVSIQSNHAILRVSPEGSLTITGTINSYVNAMELLTCGALGGPNNTFEWRKRGNGSKLGSTAEIIVNITSAFSGGEYECFVSNPAGNDSIVTTVNVAPRITNMSDLILVEAQKNGIIFCQAEGFPTPSFMWYFNTSVLLESTRVTIENVTVNDLIVISEVTIFMTRRNDSGNYTCHFTSSIPTYDVASSIIVLYVQGFPAQTKSVQAFNITSRSIHLIWVKPQSDNAPILYYQVAYMEPNFFRGERNRLVNTTEENLAITNLFPGVNYSFIITSYNAIGSSLPSAPLTAITLEEGPSSAPLNVSFHDIMSTSITVNWVELKVEERNGLIRMYEVMYLPLGNFGRVLQVNSANVTGTELSVVLIGLQEFINYNISVRAYTSASEGPYSLPLTVSTLEDVPSSPPVNVNATAISSTSISVVWDMVPFLDQNGIITMYEVLFSPLDIVEGTIETKIAMVSSGSELSVVMIGLQEYIKYAISVRAFTVVGSSSYSVAQIEQTFQDVPDGFPQKVTATVLSFMSIYVQWEMVPFLSQNGIITYEVILDPNIAKNTSSLNIIIDNLNTNFVYNITVRAFTNIGPGPPSFPGVSVKTLESSPPTKYLIKDPMQITRKVIKCVVVVVLGQADSNLSMYNTAGPYSDGDTSYITAVWDSDAVYAGQVPNEVIVGDDAVYIAKVGGTKVKYRNVRLKSNTQYSFFIRYDIENEINPRRIFSGVRFIRTGLLYSNVELMAFSILFLILWMLLIVIILYVLYRYGLLIAPVCRKQKDNTITTSSDKSVSLEQIIADSPHIMPKSCEQ